MNQKDFTDGLNNALNFWNNDLNLNNNKKTGKVRVGFLDHEVCIKNLNSNDEDIIGQFLSDNIMIHDGKTLVFNYKYQPNSDNVYIISHEQKDQLVKIFQGANQVKKPTTLDSGMTIINSKSLPINMPPQTEVFKDSVVVENTSRAQNCCHIQ